MLHLRPYHLVIELLFPIAIVKWRTTYKCNTVCCSSLDFAKTDKLIRIRNELISDPLAHRYKMSIRHLKNWFSNENIIPHSRCWMAFLVTRAILFLYWELREGYQYHRFFCVLIGNSDIWRTSGWKGWFTCISPG